MSHSVAEAKNRLSLLIERALEGEEIVITRDGHPVVLLKPVVKPAHPATQPTWIGLPSIG